MVADSTPQAGDRMMIPPMGNAEKMARRERAIQRGIAARSMLHDTKHHTDVELYWLCDLAEKAPGGTAVECGVKWGGSLICIATIREGRGPIVAVDNWVSKTEQLFRQNIALYELEVEILTMPSWEAPARIKGEVAFCFIDADHGEDGIPRDIAVWPPKIMPRGILAFHDYNVWKPGVVVKREVDKWQVEATWEKMGQIGSTIAFRRPG